MPSAEVDVAEMSRGLWWWAKASDKRLHPLARVSFSVLLLDIGGGSPGPHMHRTRSINPKALHAIQEKAEHILRRKRQKVLGDVPKYRCLLDELREENSPLVNEVSIPHFCWY